MRSCSMPIRMTQAGLCQWMGSSIGIRSMMNLCLTYDHRIVDGADAGRFLSALKKRLEEGAFEV